MELLRVGMSKILGKGNFAASNIKKGQTICLFTGESCNLNEIRDRIKIGKENEFDPLQIDEETYLDLDESTRLFNHSCNPNAFVNGKNELVALRNILKGEEITFDYSTTIDEDEMKFEHVGLPYHTLKCNCLSKNCRKTVEQFKNLPEKVHSYYLKNKFVPDFILRKFSK